MIDDIQGGSYYKLVSLYFCNFDDKKLSEIKLIRLMAKLVDPVNNLVMDHFPEKVQFSVITKAPRDILPLDYRIICRTNVNKYNVL